MPTRRTGIESPYAFLKNINTYIYIFLKMRSLGVSVPGGDEPNYTHKKYIYILYIYIFFYSRGVASGRSDHPEYARRARVHNDP